MALKREQIAAWQRRIEETFRGPNGICGERALRLNEAERVHQREALGHTHGFMRLMDAFQDFAIQTIDESLTHTPTVHAFRLAFFIASLRRFHVGLNVFWQGYYFDAAANMRAVSR